MNTMNSSARARLRRTTASLCKPAFAMFLGATAMIGCHRVTFVNARTPSSEPAIRKQLNSAIVAEVVEIDPPVRIDRKCPQGWGKVEMRRSAYTAVLEFAGGWVYSARQLSAYCADGPQGKAADSATPATDSTRKPGVPDDTQTGNAPSPAGPAVPEPPNAAPENGKPPAKAMEL